MIKFQYSILQIRTQKWQNYVDKAEKLFWKLKSIEYFLAKHLRVP